MGMMNTEKKVTPEVVRLLWVSFSISLGVFFFTYLFFVSSGVGQEIDVQAYLGRESVSRRVLSIDRGLLSVVGLLVMVVIAILMLVLAGFRRRIEVGFTCVGGFALTVIGAELFKRYLPWEQLTVKDNDLPVNLVFDTYPSGHTTITTTACLMFVVLAPPKLRPWLGVALGIVSTGYATAVVVAGWHRPSDALGGIAWSGAVTFVTILVAIKISHATNIDQHQISLRDRIWNPTTPLALACALVLIGVLCFTAYFTGDQFVDLDLAFVFMMILIVFGGMALSVWAGQLLQQVHWSRHDELLSAG